MPEKIGELHPYLVQVLNPSGTVEGTGFLCHHDGFVLTCWHVMEPWRKESTTKGTVRYAGKLVSADWLLERSDQAADLAVLKLEIPDDQEILSLPLDVYEVHQRTELTDPLESVGYPVGQFQESGIATTAHLQGKSPTKVNGLTMYPVTGFYVGNINHGYSGAPFFNRTTHKVVGMVHAKQHDKQAFLIPLTPIFTRWPELRTFHDVFEHIRQRLGQRAQSRLDERLRGAPFIPPKLEVGSIPKPDGDDRTGPKSEVDTQAYTHGRQWEAFLLKQLLPPRKSFVLSSDVGTGKSVFLDWLAVELVNKTRAVPIVMTCQALEQLNSPTRDDMIRTVLEQLRGEFSSHDIEAFIAESAQKGQLVFLFDGLDQIGSDKPSALVAQVLSTVVRHPVLITSRPSAVLTFENDAKWDFLRLQPFSARDQRIYFGAHYAKSQNVCSTAPDLIRVPMLAYMVRALITVEKSAESLTRTELYERFIKYVLSTHEPNRPISLESPDLAQDVQHELQRLAYSALAAHTPNIQKVPMSVYPKDARVKIAELPTFGLLNRIVDQGEQALFFTHQSFQEFLAAKYAVAHPECVDKILTERWHPKWAEVIRFLAGLQGEVLVQRLLTESDNVIHSNLFLAARCAGETKQLAEDKRVLIVKQLVLLFETHAFGDNAAEAIASLRHWLGKVQIEWLITQMCGNDHSVRWNAVKTLRGLSARLDTESLNTIVDLCRDDDKDIRYAVLSVLSSLGDPLQTTTLRTVAKEIRTTHPEMYCGAIQLLRSLGEQFDAATLSVIVDWTRTRNKEVCQAALETLGELREQLDAIAVNAIVIRTRDNNKDIQIAALRALGKLGKQLDATAINTIVERTRDSDSYIRLFALQSLCELGEQLDDTALSAIVRCTTDQEFLVRHASTCVVTELSRKFSPHLSDITNKTRDKDVNVRFTAINLLFALREHLDEQALNAIAERLQDQDEHMRKAALKILGEVGEHLDDQTLNAIVALTLDDSLSVRHAAIEALGRQGARLGTAAFNAIINRLHDRNVMTCALAVEVLGKLGSPLDVTTLSAVIPLTNPIVHPEIRMKAITTLAKSGERLDATTLKAITGMILDDCSAVRHTAVEALGRLSVLLDATTVNTAIDRFYHTEPEYMVKILKQLGHKLNTATLLKLAQLLTSRRYGRDVRAALEQLYQSGVMLPTITKGKARQRPPGRSRTNGGAKIRREKQKRGGTL